MVSLGPPLDWVNLILASYFAQNPAKSFWWVVVGGCGLDSEFGVHLWLGWDDFQKNSRFFLRLVKPPLLGLYEQWYQ